MKTKSSALIVRLALIVFCGGSSAFAVEHGMLPNGEPAGPLHNQPAKGVPGVPAGLGNGQLDGSSKLQPINARDDQDAESRAPRILWDPEREAKAAEERYLRYLDSREEETRLAAEQALTSLGEKLGKLDVSQTAEARTILSRHFEGGGADAADGADLIAVVHGAVSAGHRAAMNFLFPVTHPDIPGLSTWHLGTKEYDKQMKRAILLGEMRDAIEARNPRLAPYFTRMALAWRGNVPEKERQRYRELQGMPAVIAAARSQSNADPRSGLTDVGRFARSEKAFFSSDFDDTEMRDLERKYPDLKRGFFRSLWAALRGDVSSYSR